MGCCCIQATFQAADCTEARILYDQLTPIAPIVIALSASSPIWRGHLADIDCRWNVLKQAFDDRNSEERGDTPLLNSKRLLRTSRFDSTDVYLSDEGANYNDFAFDKDDHVYERLTSSGMVSPLANHFASMFTRDPILLYQDNIDTSNPDDTTAFDLFNCSNWRLLRFKPPPIKSEESNQIGWRVEFRPTELQFTDFENTAFATFVILLTQAIRQLGLNFLIPITKVGENMDRAQHRNACLDDKFHFRQNVSNSRGEPALVAEMSIDQIINGSGEFKGLIALIDEYLATKEMSAEDRVIIDAYLNLFRLRASGRLMTPAAWIRKFVRQHDKYMNDSKINEEINYDLMWSIYRIQNNLLECPDLLP